MAAPPSDSYGPLTTARAHQPPPLPHRPPLIPRPWSGIPCSRHRLLPSPPGHWWGQLPLTSQMRPPSLIHPYPCLGHFLTGLPSAAGEKPGVTRMTKGPAGSGDGPTTPPQASASSQDPLLGVSAHNAKAAISQGTLTGCLHLPSPTGLRVPAMTALSWVGVLCSEKQKLQFWVCDLGICCQGFSTEVYPIGIFSHPERANSFTNAVKRGGGAPALRILGTVVPRLRLRRRNALPGGRPHRTAAIAGSVPALLCECPQLSSVLPPDMSLQDSTLSREGKPEAEIMAAVFFSVGPLSPEVTQPDEDLHLRAEETKLVKVVLYSSHIFICVCYEIQGYCCGCLLLCRSPATISPEHSLPPPFPKVPDCGKDSSCIQGVLSPPERESPLSVLQAFAFYSRICALGCTSPLSWPFCLCGLTKSAGRRTRPTRRIMPTLLKPSSRCSGGSTCLDQRKLSHEPSLHGSLLGIQVLPHCTPGGQGILYGKNKPPLISMGCKNSQIQRRQCQNRKDVIAQGRQQMWEQEVLPHAAGAPQPPLAPLLVLVASRWHDPYIHP
ncbi:uncharacterized protein [Chlorocebus sabaeus]|uniref:uncharacterized protein n=1 Tax=Chlorocebus sabaeus TaxID=60711 RepID=UPI003BF9E8FF